MKINARPFRTNFYLWNGVAALFFSACVTHPHSHNTMQVFVDLQDGFKCRLSGGNWQPHRLLILRENVIHELDTNGSVQLLIYLDADSTIGQQLKAAYLHNQESASPELHVPALLHPGDLQRAMLEHDPALLAQVIARVFSLLTANQPVKQADERVAKAEALIAAGPPAVLTIHSLADAVCLSESRLRALFKQQTGVSIYRYLLWARLRYGISQLMAGSSVGEAALVAGFSDSSHFHKMLVQLFGLSPSQFLSQHQTMNVISCDQSPLRFKTKVYDRHQRLLTSYS